MSLAAQNCSRLPLAIGPNPQVKLKGTQPILLVDAPRFLWQMKASAA